ncbi:MAG: HAD hydrolase family protein [Staphylothermus sp.]|nr:HAD hydrolase family protein [Staphylothermus sp.]
MDGCLLDKTYDYRQALPAINFIKKQDFILILNTSKTRYEVEYYIDKWNLRGKEIFIVENGATIFMNKSLVKEAPLERYTTIDTDNYFSVILGLRRDVIEKKIKDIIESTSDEILWLKNITPKHFSELTGLPLYLSEKALMRDFSTLFHPLKKNERLQETIEKIESRGLNVSTGSGIIYLVTGRHDKGLATKTVLDLLRKEHISDEVITIGVGDGANDLPMLLVTDISVVLGRNEHLLNNLRRKNYVIHIPYKGPDAWFKGVKKAVEIVFEGAA